MEGANRGSCVFVRTLGLCNSFSNQTEGRCGLVLSPKHVAEICDAHVGIEGFRTPQMRQTKVITVVRTLPNRLTFLQGFLRNFQIN